MTRTATTTPKRDGGQHAARVVDPIVQVVGALDAWWVKYGVGWSAVRTLVSVGHDEEDILGELRATLIARQGMGSRLFGGGRNVPAPPTMLSHCDGPICGTCEGRARGAGQIPQASPPLVFSPEVP